jgi:hypothetical protein
MRDRKPTIANRILSSSQFSVTDRAQSAKVENLVAKDRRVSMLLALDLADQA